MFDDDLVYWLNGKITQVAKRSRACGACDPGPVAHTSRLIPMSASSRCHRESWSEVEAPASRRPEPATIIPNRATALYRRSRI
jgi:hypothetical protein